MRTVGAYIRVIVFMIIAFFGFELIIDTEGWSILQHPILWVVLGVLFLFAVAIEIVSEAFKSILFRTLDTTAQQRFLTAEALKKEKRSSWIEEKYKNLLGSKPIENEEEIILDHNYDGIRELDNKLPPWWVYSFYATILFAVIYMVKYEVFDGTNQEEEYLMEIAAAKEEIEEYKRTAKDLVDVTTVSLLTEASDLEAGKSIFTANCAACHKLDAGGGIGPNLVDDYWILGGGIKNVFNTISEGGRPGKGMVSWKTDLKPAQMAQVASYVLSLHGATVAEPKEPEGEIWMDPDALIDEAQVKQVDSTELKVIIQDDPVDLELEK